MAAAGRDVSFIDQAYWIILGRAPTPLELTDEAEGHLNADQFTLLRGLLTTSEFRRLRAAWKNGRETHADPVALEAALVALGRHDQFIKRTYESILGRSPDAGGAAHYAAVLAAGERRTNIVRA